MSRSREDMSSDLRARRRRLAVALSWCVAVLACAAPSTFAADFCVNSPQCDPANTLLDMTSALNAAGFHPGDDRVFVGPGVYSAANGFSYVAAGDSGALELIGAGRDATKLVSTVAPSTTLRLVGANVRDLALETPDGDTGFPALSLDAARATNVSVVAGETGVSLENAASLEDSSVTASSPGVRTSGVGFVKRSTINATSGAAVYAPKGDPFVSNSSLTGRGGVLTEGGDGHVRRLTPPAAWSWVAS
jgi:hypothetical protein